MIRHNHDWHVAAVPAPDGNWGWLIPCMGWCTKNFGDEWWHQKDGCWRYMTEGVFEFKNAADCEWFMLRWA